MTVSILIGDVRQQLRTLADNSVHCVVTSPPYWGLRDYGVQGQIGLEASPVEFIATMVEVFDEVRRVLRPNGTCWINMGDSYASNAGGYDDTGSRGTTSHPRLGAGTMAAVVKDRRRARSSGLKPKDLVGQPWRLAFALQDAGWWLRQDIIWHKPNPMPESVRDRCTKSHEYIFLMTKSERYFYDAEAIKEPVVGDPDAVRNRWDTKDYAAPGQKPQKRTSRGNGVGFGHGFDKNPKPPVTERIPAGWATGTDRRHDELGGHFTQARKDAGRDEQGMRTAARFGGGAGFREDPDSRPDMRNKRSVWTMATHSFKEAHFATFPPELPELCIKAGCPIGGTVLDPFFGAGTTGLVADRLQRDCIGIELNPVYAEIARRRIQGDATLLADVKVAA